jgi:hypothetical protein
MLVMLVYEKVSYVQARQARSGKFWQCELG